MISFAVPINLRTSSTIHTQPYMARALLVIGFILFAFSLIQVCFISPTSRSKSSKGPEEKVALFILGDSILDGGNNDYLDTPVYQRANFRPYGETYFGFPTGRFSDGRLVGDYIAEYANLPLIPPFLEPGIEYYIGANFASGGAGILDETFQSDNVIALNTQLSHYKTVNDWLRSKLGNDKAKTLVSNAVHLISIGGNDYLSTIWENSTEKSFNSKSQHVEKAIGNLTTVLKEMYKIGARKFAFLNVPPLGCHPAMRIVKPNNEDSCFDELSSIIAMHNEAFSNLLLELKKTLKHFKYSLFDFNKSIMQRVDNPFKYGFKDGKSACCGAGKFGRVYCCGGLGEVKKFDLCENPNEYVFWDSFHPTQRAYKQFADEMWYGDENYSGVSSGTYNVKQLFQLSTHVMRRSY